MTQPEFDRVYKLTAVRAHELTDIVGFGRSFFEDLETITEITDHQIEFKIEKHRIRDPNTCDITITNLATPSRDGFLTIPQRVRLAAGYGDTPRLLFLGDLRYASNEHIGTKWLTKLQLGDGARAYAEARINRTYAKGTPVATILGHLA